MKIFRYTFIQLFSYFVILFFTSCTNRNTVIEGRLTSDIYDKELVYWVPMEGASSKTVDSAYINKDAFRIKISAHNKNKIGIIRVRYQLRLDLQEILVFTEAGTIQVKLDSISSASGTPFNDVLQNWKDIKREYDQKTYELRIKLRTTGSNDENETNEEIKKLYSVYLDDIYWIVLENKNNEIGKFIYSIHKSIFTPKQINELGIIE